MEAVVQRGYGVPERVLRLEDVAEPVPGEGQVLVRVHAAGVNAADRRVVTGIPTVIRLAWRDPAGCAGRRARTSRGRSSGSVPASPGSSSATSSSARAGRPSPSRAGPLSRTCWRSPRGWTP